ncbi:eukaryotic translation initiation factor 2B subunit alpha [Brevipalpus obovatus]|uniref:eukaryotic translation initiation factor 2B subunit alpha n=1 Tax=Brevipalpus obovatus TaxID=246614 RepID=UPI003D9E2334
MALSDEEVKKIYLGFKESSETPALATCKTLNKVLSFDNSSTLQELSFKTKKLIERLKKIEPLIEVESLSEIFLRFISLTAEEYQSIDEVREALKSRGKLFEEKVIRCSRKIAKYGHPFIYEGSTVLVHSHSLVVQEILDQARLAKKRFNIYVTQSACDKSGQRTKDFCEKHGIPCKLILDSAIGYYMEKVDMVLVGADGVVESGGIINKIGTYPIALCARALNKPFYVAAESYKFIRQFPLYQRDAPQPFDPTCQNVNELSPLVDYTPPSLITLLHTDLGNLTTAAVSDVLIHLYV